MTVAIAWVATRSDGRKDLYLATDSRTRGVRVLDVSPKILTLPRTDSAVCFAGDTSISYPLMLQLSYAIAAHRPARERNLDLCELKSHLLHVMTDMVQTIEDQAEDLGRNDARLLFVGYSWRTQSFKIWELSYSPQEKRSRAEERENFHPRLHQVAFVGDRAKDLRSSVIAMLNRGDSHAPANLEPLQVLAKMLRQCDTTDSIGGAPQLVRIGPHMNTRVFSVLWGSPKVPTLFGRGLFEYENSDFWTIDPDSGDISAPRMFGSGDTQVVIKSGSDTG